MRSLFFALPFLLLSCDPVAAPTVEEVPEVEEQSETSPTAEEIAINEAVIEAYARVSFSEDAPLDHEALKAIFMPDAQLRSFRGDTLTSNTLEEFIAGYLAAIQSGEVTGFYEIELGGETEYFGNVGHRISAYATYFNGSEEVGERGVNSFQLVKVDGKWMINSIIWDIEREDQPIPDRFLD